MLTLILFDRIGPTVLQKTIGTHSSHHLGLDSPCRWPDWDRFTMEYDFDAANPSRATQTIFYPNGYTANLESFIDHVFYPPEEDEEE